MSAAAFAMSAANIASRARTRSGFQRAFFCSPALISNCMACDSFWHHIVCFQYLNRVRTAFSSFGPLFRHPLKASTTGNVCPRSSRASKNELTCGWHAPERDLPRRSTALVLILRPTTRQPA